MSRHIVAAVVGTIIGTASFAAEPTRKEAAQRGSEAVRGKPTMNPPLWSPRAYENLWKVWGLQEKPADYTKQVYERYGLHAAPYENHGLPMGLHYTQGLLGKGVINDCLLCHAGTVAGQTVIGIGNASLDLQSLFDDLGAADRFSFKFPFKFSYARGSIDPVNPLVFLMEFRAPDLTMLPKPTRLDYTPNVSSDPPAWWLLKRKQTRNWTGGVSANSVRVDMVNLLTPLNGPAAIKKHETTFADIHAFVLGVDAPKYPFPIDAKLAESGRAIYKETCARCHGLGADYPNKVVPLETVGTDALLAQSLTKKNLEYINNTWFAQEKNNEGGVYAISETPGYQAPPLDGIWATAPYLHNASVPTLHHLLDSKSRPKLFTRSFSTDKEAYDSDKVGWKITVLDKMPANLQPHEQRRIHDASQPGLSNAGHTFGDDLSAAERRALIEFLKTL